MTAPDADFQADIMNIIRVLIGFDLEPSWTKIPSFMVHSQKMAEKRKFWAAIAVF
jgi:hypothetical protein